MDFFTCHDSLFHRTTDKVDQLIIKYLQGNLSLEEQHKLSQWLEQGENNRRILNNLEIYWRDHNQELLEEELEVRKRLKNMIRNDQATTVPPQSMGSGSYGFILKIAAVLLIGVSLTLIAYNLRPQEQVVSEITMVEKISLPGQRITTFLPDGTQVKLNGDSKIIVPSRFAVDKREITLVGEAFFDVERDELRPFIIKTEDLEVKVLGTSFSVSAYPGGSQQLVAVRTGKVKVEDVGHRNSIQLNPLEMTIFHEGEDFQRKQISNAMDAFGWVDQKMVFDNQSLDEVFKKISKWYGVEIKINGSLRKDKLYTANYDNPTLKEVMDILAFVYDFEYKVNGNVLIIN